MLMDDFGRHFTNKTDVATQRVFSVKCALHNEQMMRHQLHSKAEDKNS